MIGEIIRPKRMYGAILELQKMLKDIKKQIISEPDDLFVDEDTFDNEHDISSDVHLEDWKHFWKAWKHNSNKFIWIGSFQSNFIPLEAQMHITGYISANEETLLLALKNHLN